MAQFDEKRLEWIRNHTGIRHDELSEEEARGWLRLLLRDKQAFYAHALYGFTRKRQMEKGQLYFSGQELRDYCLEFTIKIQLACRNHKYLVRFALFDSVGLTLLRDFQLIRDEVPASPWGGLQ